MRHAAPSSTDRTRGTATVEFALILPVFLFLTVGTASLGRALYQYNTLTKAVRSGAQYLARNCKTHSATCITTDFDAAGKNLVVYGKVAPQVSDPAVLNGLTTANVTITTSPALNPEYVTVTATYAITDIFSRVMIIPGAGTVAKPGTVTATITMSAL